MMASSSSYTDQSSSQSSQPNNNAYASPTRSRRSGRRRSTASDRRPSADGSSSAAARRSKRLSSARSLPDAFDADVTNPLVTPNTFSTTTANTATPKVLRKNSFQLKRTNSFDHSRPAQPPQPQQPSRQPQPQQQQPRQQQQPFPQQQPTAPNAAAAALYGYNDDDPVTSGNAGVHQRHKRGEKVVPISKTRRLVEGQRDAIKWILVVDTPATHGEKLHLVEGVEFFEDELEEEDSDCMLFYARQFAQQQPLQQQQNSDYYQQQQQQLQQQQQPPSQVVAATAAAEHDTEDEEDEEQQYNHGSGLRREKRRKPRVFEEAMSPRRPSNSKKFDPAKAAAAAFPQAPPVEEEEEEEEPYFPPLTPRSPLVADEKACEMYGYEPMNMSPNASSNPPPPPPPLPEPSRDGDTDMMMTMQQLSQPQPPQQLEQQQQEQHHQKDEWGGDADDAFTVVKQSSSHERMRLGRGLMQKAKSTRDLNGGGGGPRRRLSIMGKMPSTHGGGGSINSKNGGGGGCGASCASGGSAAGASFASGSSHRRRNNHDSNSNNNNNNNNNKHGDKNNNEGYAMAVYSSHYFQSRIAPPSMHGGQQQQQPFQDPEESDVFHTSLGSKESFFGVDEASVREENHNRPFPVSASLPRGNNSSIWGQNDDAWQNGEEDRDNRNDDHDQDEESSIHELLEEESSTESEEQEEDHDDDGDDESYGPGLQVVDNFPAISDDASIDLMEVFGGFTDAPQQDEDGSSVQASEADTIPTFAEESVNDGKQPQPQQKQQGGRRGVVAHRQQQQQQQQQHGTRPAGLLSSLPEDKEVQDDEREGNAPVATTAPPGRRVVLARPSMEGVGMMEAGGAPVRRGVLAKPSMEGIVEAEGQPGRRGVLARPSMEGIAEVGAGATTSRAGPAPRRLRRPSIIVGSAAEAARAAHVGAQQLVPNVSSHVECPKTPDGLQKNPSVDSFSSASDSETSSFAATKTANAKGLEYFEGPVSSPAAFMQFSLAAQDGVQKIDNGKIDSIHTRSLVVKLADEKSKPGPPELEDLEPMETAESPRNTSRQVESPQKPPPSTSRRTPRVSAGKILKKLRRASGKHADAEPPEEQEKGQSNGRRRKSLKGDGDRKWRSDKKKSNGNEESEREKRSIFMSIANASFCSNGDGDHGQLLQSLHSDA